MRTSFQVVQDVLSDAGLGLVAPSGHQAITYPQSLSPNQLTGAKKQHQPSPSKSAKQHN